MSKSQTQIGDKFQARNLERAKPAESRQDLICIGAVGKPSSNNAIIFQFLKEGRDYSFYYHDRWNSE